MKAYQIKKRGAIDKVLQLVEQPIPTPASDEVLIKVHAASINPIDIKTIEGAIEIQVLFKQKLPLNIGIDLSGEITAVGNKVVGVKEGDLVYTKLPGEAPGAFVEYVAVKASYIAHKPKNLSHEESACFPLVAITTWTALVDIAELSGGQKVLIQAGAGGIGTFAIQLAKSLGAHIATTTSTKNVDFVKELGADHVVDYKQEQFEEVLSNYDVVYDTLGDKILENSAKVIKNGGLVLSAAGAPDAQFAKANNNLFERMVFSFMNRKLTKNIKQQNGNYRFVLALSDGQMLQKITELIETQNIKPIIDTVYDFKEIPQALKQVKTGRTKGKAIIKLI